MPHIQYEKTSLASSSISLVSTPPPHLFTPSPPDSALPLLSRHGLYCKVKEFMRLCLKIAMLIYYSD